MRCTRVGGVHVDLRRGNACVRVWVGPAGVSKGEGVDSDPPSSTAVKYNIYIYGSCTSDQAKSSETQCMHTIYTLHLCVYVYTQYLLLRCTDIYFERMRVRVDDKRRASLGSIRVTISCTCPRRVRFLIEL